MSNQFKILGGILVFLLLAVIVLGARQLRKEQSQPPFSSEEGEKCIEAETREEMALSEAREIALISECVREGSLSGEHFCNEDTGTWWLDLEVDKPGCAPACVVNVATEKVEINWRCTGLIPPGEKTYCQEPRPQICSLECIVNPPYICGSDGESYCTECGACSHPEVEWYVIQEELCEGK